MSITREGRLNLTWRQGNALGGSTNTNLVVVGDGAQVVFSVNRVFLGWLVVVKADCSEVWLIRVGVGHEVNNMVLLVLEQVQLLLQ